MTKIDILWETIGKLCKTQSWQVSQGRFPTFIRDTESAVHIYQFPSTEFESSSTWRFMAADRNLICTSLYLYLYCCFLQNIVLSNGALVTAFCMYNCGWYRVFFLNCSAQISVLKRKTLFNQRGSILHREFHGTKSLIGCPSFFILVLKNGSNS